MRVLVLYNPISGAGRSIGVAERVRDAATGDGHRATLAPTRLAPTTEWLDPMLAEHDALVVVGGDGAVRMASGAAGRTDTPLYHFPAGTENLFAREFGFDRRMSRVLGALRGGRVQRVDVGLANDQRFLLMASVGFDAEVVRDLASRRTGSITHASYVAPIIRQLWRYAPPVLRIEVDGATVVSAGRGMVVVANSRQYGQRLDPARRASMCDGRLDVVFLPAPRRRDVLAWMVRCRRGRHLRRPELGYWTGGKVRVVSMPAGPFQLDGDAPRNDDVTGELVLELRAGWLPVLVPG